MTIRYELRPVGVFDREAGVEVRPPDREAWAAYELWLTQGNVPEEPVVPEPAPEDVAHELRAQVNGRRNQILKEAQVSYLGHPFACDLNSLLRAALLAVASLPGPVLWRAGDNVMVSMTPDQFRALFSLMVAEQQKIMLASFDEKDSLK